MLVKDLLGDRQQSGVFVSTAYQKLKTQPDT